MKCLHATLFLCFLISGIAMGQARTQPGAQEPRSRIQIVDNIRRQQGLPPMSSAPFLEFKIGGLAPEDVDGTGFIGGVSVGENIDDHFFWGLEGNIFINNYRKETTIARYDIPTNPASYREVQVEVDFSTTILSPYWQLYYERGIGSDIVFFRGIAGVGWVFIWNKENNFADDLPVKRTRFFNGFSWQGSLGIGLRASSLGLVFVDFYYQHARPRKSENRIENNLPVFQEIDLTGPGVRAGVNFIMMKPNLLGFIP